MLMLRWYRIKGGMHALIFVLQARPRGARGREERVLAPARLTFYIRMIHSTLLTVCYDCSSFVPNRSLFVVLLRVASKVGTLLLYAMCE